MRRRALLSTLASAATLAGCLGGSNGGGIGPEASTESRGAGTTRTSTPAPLDGPVRGRADAISTSRTYTDRPGYGDGLEYTPSNRTVRFVTYRSAEGPEGLDTWSFEEWGRIHAAEAALERVRAVVRERLGTDAFGSGMGQPPGGVFARTPVVTVNVTVADSAGGAPKSPPVTLRELAEATPRAVEATVSMDGDSHTRTVPVFAERVEVALVDSD